MRFGILPDIPVAGRAVNVWVKHGEAGGVARIDVQESPSCAAAERLEVRLDEHGNGARVWVVPDWAALHLSTDGVRVSRPVKRRLSLTMKLARVLREASMLLDFVANDAGREHGVGWRRKARMLRRLQRAGRHVRSLSAPQQRMRLVEEVMRIPRSVQGDVVECGCYGGGSTVALSLACAATGRRLFVCDSFEGLPAPASAERHHLTDGSTISWESGELASPGSLEGVQQNVRAWGDTSVCRFVPGFFADTLPRLETDAVAMVFEDADLVTSVEDCLRHLWPKLQPGCKFFSHEPWSVEIVSRFFDRGWWRENVGGDPPGFAGSGGGGSDGGRYQVPGLGYAVKG